MVPSEVHFIDGSGGRETRFPATAVARMLGAMRQRPNFATYPDTLPRLGVDGSLAFVQGKTGTCLAGSAEGPC